MQKECYTIKETAKLIGCAINTVRKAMAEGKLKYVRISDRRIVITASAIEEFLNVH